MDVGLLNHMSGLLISGIHLQFDVLHNTISQFQQTLANQSGNKRLIPDRLSKNTADRAMYPTLNLWDTRLTWTAPTDNPAEFGRVNHNDTQVVRWCRA